MKKRMLLEVSMWEAFGGLYSRKHSMRDYSFSVYNIRSQSQMNLEIRKGLRRYKDVIPRGLIASAMKSLEEDMNGELTAERDHYAGECEWYNPKTNSPEFYICISLYNDTTFDDLDD